MNIKEFKIPYFQYVVAFIVSISVPCGTIYETWTTVALPKMFNNETSFQTSLTNVEASWIVSITTLSTISGGILLVLISDKLQRKHILLFCAAFLYTSWIVTRYATSALQIIITRGIAGVGVTAILILVPLYTAEIADVEIRGRLCTSFTIVKLLGEFLVLSFGSMVSLETLALICSAFPLVSFGLLSFMPESPYYLVRKGFINKAKRNLFKLTATKEKVASRLDNIITTITNDESNKFCDIVSKKPYRKSLLILLGIKTMQHLSGVSVVELTILEIIDKSISPQLLSSFVVLIQIPAVLLSAYLVDKVGRKPLLIISALGCGLTLILNGIYFYLRITPEQMSWLPLIVTAIYISLSHLGLFTVPYVLMGEIFATNVKDASATICVMYESILCFLVMKFFSPLSNLWGMHTMLWIFAGFCVCGSILVYFKLPETKRKTFMEIQQEIIGKEATDVISISSIMVNSG